jgi:hypothetical protein
LTEIININTDLNKPNKAEVKCILILNSAPLSELLQSYVDYFIYIYPNILQRTPNSLRFRFNVKSSVYLSNYGAFLQFLTL